MLVHDVRRLERGDLPQAEVRHIEPARTWSSEAGEELPATVAAAAAGARSAADLARRCGTNLGADGDSRRLAAPSTAHSSTEHYLVIPGRRSSSAPRAGPTPASSRTGTRPGMPAAERLPWYAQRFEAVELNSSFYAVPERPTVRRWCEVTPGRAS